MMRNDYRRALILLRCNEPGWSGHVRLERRTLMGSMYFMVQPPQGEEAIYAVLVSRSRDGYAACVLGQLGRDGRGQAVLSYSFDPRSICGRELEQYQLIAVAAVSNGDCRIVLHGNVDGHADLNWERVQQAVCLSLNTVPETPGIVQPREEETQDEDAPQPDHGEGTACPLADGGIAAQAVELLEAIPVLAAHESDEAGIKKEERTGDNPEAAAAVLGVDTSHPWQEEIDGLRALFEQQPPLSDGPENGYAYVAAPLPEGSPYDFLAVGLRAENGQPIAVSYALPAAYTAEPPAGMEAYRWLGDGNRGWWISEIDLNTGAQI